MTYRFVTYDSEGNEDSFIQSFETEKELILEALLFETLGLQVIYWEI
jgi:hypothetical protein